MQVVITSESRGLPQKTVITWPNGGKDTFVTAKPATPDSGDDNYDAAHPTVVTYGMVSYETGTAESTATVEVWEKLPADPAWKAIVLTRLREPDKARKRVESKGHKNLARSDWSDTVVSFTW